MSVGEHIPQEDLALYAMQLLTPAEAAALRVHIEGCADCRRELAEIHGTLAALALSVEQQPVPTGARERLLARLGPATLPNVIPMRNSRPARRRLFPILLPWAAAAAMFVFAGHLHQQNHDLQNQINADRSQIGLLSAQASQAAQVMDTLTGPTAQQATLTEGKRAAVPTGHTSYVPERGALVFVANHLRPIPGAKTYELWIIPADGQAPVPAGTFRPDANGSASVVLPVLPLGIAAKAFGVTVENEGGALSPTLPIVLSGS